MHSGWDLEINDRTGRGSNPEITSHRWKPCKRFASLSAVCYMREMSQSKQPGSTAKSRGRIICALVFSLLQFMHLEGATLVFGLEGTECTACFYSVSGSVREIPGVTAVTDVTGLGDKARVTFDESRASAHRIAHAVFRAFPLHGKPYRASLTIRIPEYDRNGNADKVTAVFARWKPWLDAEVIERNGGRVTLRFHPLAKAELKRPLPGWRLSVLRKALTTPPPAGLGLRVVFPDDH